VISRRDQKFDYAKGEFGMNGRGSGTVL